VRPIGPARAPLDSAATRVIINGTRPASDRAGQRRRIAPDATGPPPT
jgi:hypothetical protein